MKLSDDVEWGTAVVYAEAKRRHSRLTGIDRYTLEVGGITTAEEDEFITFADVEYRGGVVRSDTARCTRTQ